MSGQVYRVSTGLGHFPIQPQERDLKGLEDKLSIGSEDACLCLRERLGWNSLNRSSGDCRDWGVSPCPVPHLTSFPPMASNIFSS